MNNAGNAPRSFSIRFLRSATVALSEISQASNGKYSVFLVALQHVLYLFVIVDQDRAPDDCQFHTCLNGKSRAHSA